MTEIGYILLARKICKSDIWTKKPAWWLKVWEFIVMHAFFDEGNKFERGTNYFTRDMIYYECYLMNENIKKNSVDNVIRFLKNDKMITTQKTTRGMIVTVCKYEFYQKPDSYKNDTLNKNETTQKRHRNDTETILKEKNVNNDKNEKNIYSKKFQKPTIEEIRKYCTERNNGIDAETFFHHYETNGWVQGKNKPIKNWKSAVITWEKNNKQFNNQQIESDNIPTRFYDPDNNV